MFMTGEILAQQKIYPIPFYDNNTNKWGYYDGESYYNRDEMLQITIKPQYDEAGTFVNGIALVRIGNIYLYINEYGDPADSGMIIKTQLISTPLSPLHKVNINTDDISLYYPKIDSKEGLKILHVGFDKER